MDRKVTKCVFVVFIFMGLSSVITYAAKFECKTDEWSCDDGTCIDASLKCNGVIDCHDASDETFLLCINNQCNHLTMHRCVYGGCVPKNATCNGVKDCIDNSDELLLECRNETSYYKCLTLFDENSDQKEIHHQCFLKATTCKDGQELGNFLKCDGKVDCEDGSDETLESCSTDWIPNCLGQKFQCKYGGCLDRSKACNGVIDCADGSDELDGLCSIENRQDNGEWNCKDGSRIDVRLKCNGALDCPDGSDETFLTCWNNEECSIGYSKCAYGACVKNNVFCNDVQDCADNSDELFKECRNETLFNMCGPLYYYPSIYSKDLSDKEVLKEQLQRCISEDKTCDNGDVLQSFTQKCNGIVDCADGSDETLMACATDRLECSTYRSKVGFRCEYGACIDKLKVCNKVNDCADGSDELDGICYEGKCVLPEFPKNGNYTVLENPNPFPGQLLDSAMLVYRCFPGYKLHGTSRYVNCLKGSWPYDPPKCLSQCHLKKDPSVVYWCLSRGPLSMEEEKECGELVPDGATVRAECREPVFHYAGVLPFMHCVEGSWDHPVPTCSPQCGLVTSEGDKQIINGKVAKKGELPWHAAIYDKRTEPYQQICGGSLISRTIIISAAHCFWSDVAKLIPARHYAVSLGKLYRPWNYKYEQDDQKSYVKQIIIPPRFRGAATNFQEDIALVILTKPVEYRSYVLPVCVDFGITFERKQLAVNNTGKVAGWGLTDQDGKSSLELQVADLPYLDINECFAASPPAFHKFISGDKFCAGNYNSSAMCMGDSGGGLVFPSNERGETRYFLRGVVSTAPRNDHICNAFVHTTFTQVSKHEAFILEHWN